MNYQLREASLDFKVEIKRLQDPTPCWAAVYHQHVSDCQRRGQALEQCQTSASLEDLLCIPLPLLQMFSFGDFLDAAASVLTQTRHRSWVTCIQTSPHQGVLLLPSLIVFPDHPNLTGFAAGYLHFSLILILLLLDILLFVCWYRNFLSPNPTMLSSSFDYTQLITENSSSLLTHLTPFTFLHGLIWISTAPRTGLCSSDHFTRVTASTRELRRVGCSSLNLDLGLFAGLVATSSQPCNGSFSLISKPPSLIFPPFA